MTDFHSDIRKDGIIAEELEERKPQAEPLYCPYCHKYLGLMIEGQLYKNGSFVMRVHSCKGIKQERSV